MLNLYKNKDWLEGQYFDLGKTDKEIAKPFGVSPGTIRHWRRVHGIVFSSNKEAYQSRRKAHAKRYGCPVVFQEGSRIRVRGMTKDWLEEQYHSLGKSTPEIARDLGISTNSLAGWIRKLNVEYRGSEEIAERHSKRMSGKGNPAYKNGNSHYYVKRRLTKAKPKICEWCHTADDVQIHHIDHDTENNEPENLMWLCGPCNRMEAQLWQLQQANRVKVNHINNRLIIEFLGE